MTVQIQFGTDPGNYKQDEHEPGIDGVLIYVIILDFKIGDLAGHAGYPFCVIHVKYMVNDHQHYGDPPDVIQIMLSGMIIHIYTTFLQYTTFATIFNISVFPYRKAVYQAKFTFGCDLCYFSWHMCGGYFFQTLLLISYTPS